MDMRLLIGIPSPRDLPDFAAAIQKLPHDKYWVKYTPYSQDPYGKIRAFFLEHREYTHLAICPDDLIVTPEGAQRILDAAESHPVVMGTCNVEIADHPDGNLALTKNLPSKERQGRIYEFYTRKELEGQTLLQVPWCGTPFAVFSRKVIEWLEFRGDARWNGYSDTQAYDIGIAHDLAELGIPIMVCADVYFYHHRTRQEHSFVGKLEPDWWYDHDGIREKDPVVARKRLLEAYNRFMQDGGLGPISANGNRFLSLVVEALTR